MKAETLDRFAKFAVSAKAASYEDVFGLTADELSAYRRVSAKALLLEQEKIPHAYAVEEICSALVQRP